MNRDIYEAITERFIEQLKRGTVPWQKPWFAVQNIVSRKPYRGSTPCCLARPINPRSGSRSSRPTTWVAMSRRREIHAGHLLQDPRKAGQSRKRNHGRGRQARSYSVRPVGECFQSEQTEGFQAPTMTTTQSASRLLEKAAAIVENARLCPIHHAGFAAWYSPKDDVIRIPAPATFRSQEDYYHSLYHEMIHASGHRSRLNREGVAVHARFDSEPYCREELIAELGAAFLSNEAGILSQVQFENSAAYLHSWIQKLESDPRLIVSAASQAQRASDYIRGIEHKEALQECQISPEGMPLTWAQEHGIDTRIPGFVHHDHDGDGVSTLLEWKHGTRPTDRLSRPSHGQSLSL
jgi:antirestriction protein ArdC